MPATGAYYSIPALTSMLATLGSTALRVLVPVTLHLPSEWALAGAGHKTEIRALGFVNGYGTPFSVLWPLILASIWLAAQPSA